MSLIRNFKFRNVKFNLMKNILLLILLILICLSGCLGTTTIDERNNISVNAAINERFEPKSMDSIPNVGSIQYNPLNYNYSVTTYITNIDNITKQNLHTVVSFNRKSSFCENIPDQVIDINELKPNHTVYKIYYFEQNIGTCDYSCSIKESYSWIS
jgi:hypothetical protein